MTYDPRRRRSVSQLASWTKCQEAYRLERLEKKPSPPAGWTIMGQAFHQTIELWEGSGRTSDLESLYPKVWDTNLRKATERYPDLTTWTRTPGTKNTENDLKLREAQGLKQVMTYVDRAQREAGLWKPLVMPDGSLGVEVEFTLEFPGEDFTLLGYIDVVQQWSNGDITVVDLKTGRDDREDYRQLGLYRAALEENFGLDIKFGRYWYSKLDRGSEWIDLSRYTKDYILDQYRRLDSQIENATRDNLFLANPSKSGCKFCSVKQFCSEMAGR